MKQETTSGKCVFCGEIFGKSSVGRHLAACQQRAAAHEKESKPGARQVKLFHLSVQGRYLPEYWMHLEMPARLRLNDLDEFLREIWLECCGHMSAFTIGEQEYCRGGDAELEMESAGVALERVLEPGATFYHDYDFGTTTRLTLKVVAERQGVAAKPPIRILSRNEPPEIQCETCKSRPATEVCAQCLWEGKGWLCKACAAKHECGEDMLLPVVNSPRVGMCAYAGP